MERNAATYQWGNSERVISKKAQWAPSGTQFVTDNAFSNATLTTEMHWRNSGFDYESATANLVWTSRDPIRLAGGLNVYVYSNNSPLKYVDPIGLGPNCDNNPEGCRKNAYYLKQAKCTCDKIGGFFTLAFDPRSGGDLVGGSCNVYTPSCKNQPTTGFDRNLPTDVSVWTEVKAESCAGFDGPYVPSIQSRLLPQLPTVPSPWYPPMLLPPRAGPQSKPAGPWAAPDIDTRFQFDSSFTWGP
jgi:RHS repeat-associated protein